MPGGNKEGRVSLRETQDTSVKYYTPPHPHSPPPLPVSESLRASRGTSEGHLGPPKGSQGWERGERAYIELAMYRRLVDSIENTVLVLTAGGVEEISEGRHTVLGVACPFNRDVLCEVQGICSVDTGRLIQRGQ